MRARVWRVSLTTVAVMTVAVTWRVTSPQPQAARGARATPSAGVYSADPNHLWNRIDRLFHVRTASDGTEYGADEVDPLLWPRTHYLLTGASHAQAIRLLGEFLESHGERLVTTPLKRAVFQHDLWAVFDWLAAFPDVNPDARKALMPPIARVLRRVALSPEEIQKLPDNYAAARDSHAYPNRFDETQPDRAFLPADILDVAGPWVTVGGTQVIAATHAGAFSHSAFMVIWRVPGNNTATKEYLQTVWDFPEPYVLDAHASFDGERRDMVNPALPAIPIGTHLALVRRMLLIDSRGGVVPSPITEDVQLRVLREHDPRFFEFRLRRRRLFDGDAGGLEAVRAGDTAFLTFSSQGDDVFEATNLPYPYRPGEILQTCRSCHERGLRNRPALDTVLSLPQLLRPHPLVDPQHPRWARWLTQGVMAADHKAGRADWGLLQGLWQSTPW